MSLKHLLPAFSILGAAAAAPHPGADAKVNWGTCDDPVVARPLALTNLDAECANFTVPLDYSASDGETIELQIARVKAPFQPAKGTILLNFGGPGQEARGGLAGQVAQLLALSGGEYNLAAFDPRGTANTIPHECFPTTEQFTEFFQAQTWYDFNDTTLEQLWDRATFDAETCYKAHEKIQPYLGTASVARDLMSVVDALGEDGMLRYWGFSYGTTLGATVAAMFPERIDKLVIDGVQNPHEYYHANADYEEWSDSDRVFSEIFRSCVDAGPLKCPMAAFNYTAVQMESIAYDIAENLKTNPIQLGNGAVFDYTILRNFYAQSLYSPASWPGLAGILTAMAANQTSNEAFLGNATAIYGLLYNSSTSFPPLYGIHCSDRVPRLDTLEDFMPVQERLSNVSKVMDGGSTTLSMACAQWKTDAKERYEGDFQVETKNPILVSTNKYDGHTPLRSAQNVSSGFDGSGLLVVNGFGHTTLAQPSICNIRHTSAYWINGTLPDKDFVCEVDAVPYGNYTWLDAIQAVYGDSLGNHAKNGTGPQPPSGTGNDSQPSPPPPGSSADRVTGTVPTAILTCVLALLVTAV